MSIHNTYIIYYTRKKFNFTLLKLITVMIGYSYDENVLKYYCYS